MWHSRRGAGPEGAGSVGRGPRGGVEGGDPPTTTPCWALGHRWPSPSARRPLAAGPAIPLRRPVTCPPSVRLPLGPWGNRAWHLRLARSPTNRRSRGLAGPDPAQPPAVPFPRQTPQSSEFGLGRGEGGGGTGKGPGLESGVHKRHRKDLLAADRAKRELFLSPHTP